MFSFFILFFLLIGVLVLLSAINKSIGARKLYVQLLLKIFEFGRANIESSQRHDEIHTESKEAGDEKCESALEEKNGGVTCNGNSVISRDNVLQPVTDKESSSNIQLEPKNVQVSFQLEKCLTYVKAGVEAIIEDQVTSRFEAEELKNWNLLTRTNRRYEFISWKLTIIWMIGFFVRYVVLMPLRVIVCFIGVLIAIVSNCFAALIPFYFIRQPVASLCYKLTFRIFARSLSTVITVHNEQYKPKKAGFCVANHTSPIDIAVLSTDCTFSLVIWLTVCTSVVGCLPEGDKKRAIVHDVLGHCFSLLSSAISAVVYYHNIENRPSSGICVANHTSPIDVLVLMCDTTYSLIGQRHGGFLGLLQRALARASPHIWFERAEVKDRHTVAERLRQHVSDPKNPPILIFPEGTCINNTSVMQFKKGSFEVGGIIYPVAIKYDPRFGDAFWNSSKYSMMQYLYMMMTSWAIVCDVWYLPPMYRQEGESAIDFANRVKSVIAKQGGLVDLVWDGQLKRLKPKKEWMEMQQIEFAKSLKND
ncbi:glycerol-3-phosphate acyltransferase 3 isoform X1 [Eupeodes corollae]|uniref:glycerol-3-phosphate acyltransferase 3 isoform X1 n=1 Tax=Eupeodes corollae TaxID=290404 RepID=UPI0024900250|nr:glycerol-3-phosphate acyltransferase 3 isoform X1 [Eupeodes corollae]